MSNHSQIITIRHAIPDDLPAIVAIYNQSVVTKQATADLQPVRVADRQAWFDAHSMAKKRPLLVAVNYTGEVLGWASLSNLYDRPAYHISTEISVYIDTQVKGQGLAQRLIDALVNLAPSLGVQQIVALIFAHNTPSIRLFTKLGFKEWGKLPQLCDMEGFVADVVMLGKSVQ